MNGGSLLPSQLGAARGSALWGRVVPAIDAAYLVVRTPTGNEPQRRPAEPRHGLPRSVICTFTARLHNPRSLLPHLFPHRRGKP
jgi:hypothetical protein